MSLISAWSISMDSTFKYFNPSSGGLMREEAGQRLMREEAGQRDQEGGEEGGSPPTSPSHEEDLYRSTKF